MKVYVCLKSLDIWIHGYIVDIVLPYSEMLSVSLNPGYIWINGYLLDLIYLENVCVSQIAGCLDIWIH